MHLGNAAAERRVVLHLAQHVCEKEHLAIAAAGDERVFGVAVVLDDEARIFDVLVATVAAHSVEVALPAFAVRRIGEHEVEGARANLVVRERREGGTADDVIRRVTVAFEQQVSFADGVRFSVDFLAVKVRGDLLAVFASDPLERFLGDGQHAASAARTVVE